MFDIKQQYKERVASAELEAFVDFCHQKAKEAGFPYVGRFEMMRHQHGTLVAMALLVFSGEFQSGFIGAEKTTCWITRSKRA